MLAVYPGKDASLGRCLVDQQMEQLFGWLILAGIIVLVCYRKKWIGTGCAYGSARWADEADMKSAGMYGNQGLILGRDLKGKIIRMANYVHTYIIAPSGAGKGISFVLVTLLSYVKGSIFHFDPTGDNFRLTANRRQAIGQRVIRLEEAFRVGVFVVDVAVECANTVLTVVYVPREEHVVTEPVAQPAIEEVEPIARIVGIGEGRFAICAKVGNLWFPFVYFGVGLLASLVNAMVSGAPGIGASAAINGIVGIFLVWYALNSVNFFWFFWY